ATGYSPVEILVRVEAQFQVELALGVLAAERPRHARRLRHGISASLDVIRRHQESSDAVHDHLTEPAAPERDHRSPARLSFRGGQSEWLVPPGGTQYDRGSAHDLPQLGPGHRLVNGHPRPVAPRIDLFAAVPEIVDVTVDVDA